MYLVVFKVDMRNHLQVVLDIRVPPFPHMTARSPFYSQLLCNITNTTEKWETHQDSKKLSEMQHPHQYQEWKGGE